MALQTGETKLVVDCKLKPTAGHVKMTLVPERWMASCGGAGSARLKTVPKPETPPLFAVPYNTLPDKINAAWGLTPSLLVKTPMTESKLVSPEKLCKTVIPAPLVLRANTVPLPELPPAFAVPYSVLPDKINPADGLAP